METTNKILVLGATGHLGAYTALHLKEKGYEVTAVGHRADDNGFFRSKGIEYIGGFSLEEASGYSRLPQDIEAVVHLAGAMPAHAGTSPMPYVQSIVAGMVNLCEWLAGTKCRRVIFNTTPSDVAAFFGSSTPIPDDAPRSFPKDGGDHAVYAIAKNAACDILEHYGYAHGISSCIFRHLTVYGYQPDPHYILNGERRVLPWRIIQQRALQGEPIEVWGNPQSKKELLYIKDFASAVEQAIVTGAEGILNLSGYRHYTLEEQIDGLIEAFAPEGRKSEKVYRPEKPDSPQNLLASGKARKVLQWTPRYDWPAACRDMREEMDTEPMALLWGYGKDFLEGL